MRIPRSPKACSRRLRTCTARQFTSSVRDMTKPKEGPGRKPEWLKKPLPKAGALREMERLLRERSLHTVCEGARCPNKGECFEHGTATFLIMGGVCSRNCRFCSVDGGRPAAVHAAKAAVAAAHPSHDQEGGGPMLEALPLVGAASALADGMKASLPQQPFHLPQGARLGQRLLEPLRLAPGSFFGLRHIPNGRSELPRRARPQPPRARLRRSWDAHGSC